LLAYRRQRIEPRGVAVGMHHHQRANAAAGRAIARAVGAAGQGGPQVRGQLVGIHSERGLLAVHEVGDRPGVRDGIDRPDEGQARHQHLVVRLHPGETQAGVKRDRAVRHRHRFCRAGEGGEILLESLDELPDRRHPAGLDTLAEVGDLVAREDGIVQRLGRLRVGRGRPHRLNHPPCELLTGHEFAYRLLSGSSTPLCTTRTISSMPSGTRLVIPNSSRSAILPKSTR
jgi:hypothetical protein